MQCWKRVQGPPEARITLFDNDSRQEFVNWRRRPGRKLRTSGRSSSPLTTRVMGLMQGLQSRLGHMCVYLGGGQVAVTQQHLYRTQIGAVVEQVGGKCVTQGMR